MKEIDVNIRKAIEWSTEFETGIPRIDVEHQIFLELVNSYREALYENCDKTILLSIIDEIEKYAQFHFTSEENIMMLIGYPGLEAHRLVHYDVLEGLNIAKHDTEFPLKFLSFVYKWFIHHSTMEDKRIGDFIKANNIIIPRFLHMGNRP